MRLHPPPTRDSRPHRAAWADAAVNRDAGDFYAATRETVEDCWVRRRFDGWIAFQSGLPRKSAARSTTAGRPSPVVDALRTRWRDARYRARGPADI